jgi:hypothetical protein
MPDGSAPVRAGILALKSTVLGPRFGRGAPILDDDRSGRGSQIMLIGP